MRMIDFDGIIINADQVTHVIPTLAEAGREADGGISPDAIDGCKVTFVGGGTMTLHGKDAWDKFVRLATWPVRA